MNVFYGSKYVTTTITFIWSYLNGKRTEFGHSCRHNVDGVARNPIKLSRIITNYYTITCKILLSKLHIYPGITGLWIWSLDLCHKYVGVFAQAFSDK